MESESPMTKKTSRSILAAIETPGPTAYTRLLDKIAKNGMDESLAAQLLYPVESNGCPILELRAFRSLMKGEWAKQAQKRATEHAAKGLKQRGTLLQTAIYVELARLGNPGSPSIQKMVEQVRTQIEIGKKVIQRSSLVNPLPKTKESYWRLSPNSRNRIMVQLREEFQTTEKIRHGASGLVQQLSL